MPPRKSGGRGDRLKGMSTRTVPGSLPFELGEPRSFGGLALVPLFPASPPRLEYLGLDEALARGLSVTELGEVGEVGALLVENPLPSAVLLYEGEALLGAKQDRIVARSVLVAARSARKLPATCVEQGRWGWRSRRFSPAAHAAYPELRRAQRAGQAAAWRSVAAKAARLEAFSATGAAEEIYRERSSALEEYVQAFPRLPGQAGFLVGIAGELVCLDYVSRSDVFAGLYAKLLRGYALDALESPLERPLRAAAVGRFLGELELAERARRPAGGLGEEGELAGYALGAELTVEGEVIALTAFPARAATP